MTINVNRAVTFVLLAGVLALQASPAFAQFTGAGTAATNWVVQIVQPLIALAVGIVGILCLTGRIQWPWFLAAVIGIALFFGRDQVVSLIRSWVGA